MILSGFTSCAVASNNRYLDPSHLFPVPRTHSLGVYAFFIDEYKADYYAFLMLFTFNRLMIQLLTSPSSPTNRIGSLSKSRSVLRTGSTPTTNGYRSRSSDFGAVSAKTHNFICYLCPCYHPPYSSSANSSSCI